MESLDRTPEWWCYAASSVYVVLAYTRDVMVDRSVVRLRPLLESSVRYLDGRVVSVLRLASPLVGSVVASVLCSGACAVLGFGTEGSRSFADVRVKDSGLLGARYRIYSFPDTVSSASFMSERWGWVYPEIRTVVELVDVEYREDPEKGVLVSALRRVSGALIGLQTFGCSSCPSMTSSVV